MRVRTMYKKVILVASIILIYATNVNSMNLHGVLIATSGASGEFSVTAKSVVFDIADHYEGSYVGANGIFFYLNDSLVSPALTDYLAYEGFSQGGYHPGTPFDPTHSVTGTGDPSISWLGAAVDEADWQTICNE